MSYSYYDSSPPPVVPAPAPPAEFVYAQPPSSSFSGPAIDKYDAPHEPLVIPVSPAPSRSTSRARGYTTGEYVVADRAHYLAPGSYGGGLHRSSSERGRIVVENRRGRRNKRYDTEYDDGYSDYSYDSYDSRAPSRSRSRHRRHHSRTPSNYSEESDGSYAVTKYSNKTRKEAELEQNFKLIQEELKKVKLEADQKRQEQERRDREKMQTIEIERKVKEQMERKKLEEMERERRERDALEAEKRRIADAAKRLLEEQAAEAKRKEEKDKAEAARIEALLEAERRKFATQNQSRKTYTRFSKVHLAKEALEERNIPFTEEAEFFLVQRSVDKQEQQYLWARTKEIRKYYQQIQEAAERAPTVRGPDGGYVKYVQIAGQPYPMALPVTVTQTPGGGQTHRVEPVKLKWKDIFRR